MTNPAKDQNLTDKLASLRSLTTRFLSRNHKRSLWIVSIWAVVLAVGEMAIAAAVIPYVECLGGNCHDVVSTTARRIELPTTALFSLIMLGLITLKLAIHAKFAWSSARLHQQVERDTVTQLMRGYFNMSWLAFNESHQTHYFRRCTTTAVDASMLVFHLVRLISSVLLLVILTALMIWYQPMVSLALIGGFVLFNLITQTFINRWQGQAAQQRENALRGWSIGLSESLASFRELRVYRLENFVIDHLSRYTGQVARNNTTLQFLPILPRVILDFSVIAVLLAVVTVWQVSENSLENLVPSLIFYAILARVMLPAMMDAMSAKAGLAGVVINLRLILDELERARCHYQSSLNVPTESTETQKQFCLQSVSFRYKSDSPLLLNQVSLTVKHPEWVAITGQSGVGKSTLLELLSGILTPCDGSVTHYWPTDGLPSHPRIAYLPQHVALIDGSLRDNVLFGDAVFDEERLLGVLGSVELQALVQTLPGGIYAHVGANGSKLSGGQRQRLAIARALYRAPDLLLLDEATSGLDKRTEYRVLEQIKNNFPAMTVIYITHRQDNLIFADRVYHLADGKLQPVNRNDR